MTCNYFDQGLCRSCAWLDKPYETQLQSKTQALHALLDPFSPRLWLAPVETPQSAFRNKAKMQALGFAHAPILGIINDQGIEVSLCDCPLYTPAMQKVLHHIEKWIQTAGITPYRIDKKKGELKYVLLTQAQESGKMMLRFVLKSTQAQERIQNYLPELQALCPELEVISINIQPVHMAILEGEEEIFLTQAHTLKERLNKVPLSIRPKSFFQTNTAVASQLYATAQTWTKELKITKMWDLFCGVGGFGLHCADKETALIGIEIEPEAIACAQASALEMGLDNVNFQALDARAFHDESQKPQLILVNPPRRGLTQSLCETLETLAPQTIIYSSCNAQTLADDLKHLPHYTLEKVQLFDMFAHTPHYEVLVLLSRK